MRLLITRDMPPAVEAAVEGFDVTRRPGLGPLTEAEATAALQEFDAVLTTLGDQFTAAAFAAAGSAPRCKILANFGVGFNHIDIAAAQAAGVAVTNTPGAVTEATADIALTLMLMAARRAGEGERLVRSGAWQGWAPMQLLGQQVSGKRLGILGMGRIGKAIARRGHFGFGMTVGYTNRSAVADPGVPAQAIALADLAAWADVLVVAVPASPATRHLIDAGVLALMPAHAILVNIARGDVVEEAALIAALSTGRIAAAGLDVYEQEPLVPQALRDLPNAVLLPHLGTAVLEVRMAMGLMALDNLRAFAAGLPLPNRVR